MSDNQSAPKLRVYYDGLCILCSREIDHYRKQVGADGIEFIDICGPQFNALEEKLDPHQIHKVMHARLSDGTVVTRVQAFIEIWNQIPRYRVIAKIARLRGINTCLEWGYSIFAFIRPYLPKRKLDDCSASPYCEIKKEN